MQDQRGTPQSLSLPISTPPTQLQDQALQNLVKRQFYGERFFFALLLSLAKVQQLKAQHLGKLIFNSQLYPASSTQS